MHYDGSHSIKSVNGPGGALYMPKLHYFGLSIVSGLVANLFYILVTCSLTALVHYPRAKCECAIVK